MTTSTVSSGQTLSGVTRSSGDQLLVYGTVSAITLLGGAIEYVEKGGSSTADAISSGGDQEVLSGGIARSAGVFSGGLQGVDSGGTASRTVVSASGTQDVDGGRAISTTVRSGGEQDIHNGGSASATIIAAGGAQDVESGSTASATIVSAGGTEYVDPGGIAIASVVLSGGIEFVASGGTASGTIVSAGGAVNIDPGGMATGISVASGGVVVVSGGSTLAGSVLANGIVEEVVLPQATSAFSGGLSGTGVFAEIGGGTLQLGGDASQFTGRLAIDGGTVELMSAGAAGASVIGFDQGTLRVDGTALPANLISGFGYGDAIDLAGLAYSSNLSATYNSAGGILTVTGNGVTGILNLAGLSPGASFALSNDGHGGTDISQSNALPNSAQEVAFIAGVNADGTPAQTSFTAWKGDDPATYQTLTEVEKYQGGSFTYGDNAIAGTPGGTVYYYFDPAANWSSAEKTAFTRAFDLWSAVANIQFVQASTFTSGTTTEIFRSSSGDSIGAPGSVTIDTSIDYWQKIASFTAGGGAGVEVVLHEEGHVLGLGHSGPYDFSSDPATQQFSPYDTNLWSIMSYFYPDVAGAYSANYPVKGTDWGTSSDFYSRMPTGLMPLDILAAQALYGLPASTPLSGGQTFGFNCNVQGPIESFFDFTVNTSPVITLWDAGGNNTLDLSGYSAAATVNLNSGTFSSCDGMINNIAIASGTAIDTAVGGSGNDTFIVNSDNDTINGGGGTNTVVFSGSFSNYTFQKNSGGIAITKSNGAQGVSDALTNIQQLQFSDRLVSVASLNFAANDLNHDGTSDLLWRHSSGTAAVWEINNAQVLASLGIGGAGTNWNIIDTGDFNGDGTADLLWRDSNSGTVAIWQMNNGQVQSSIGVSTVALNWHIVATGDFDGDGKSDLLWRDANTGTLAAWEMNGGSVTASLGVGSVASVWQVAGAGDFNGDGKSDILFRNTSTGTVAIWNMNDGQVQSSVGLGDVGLNWSIAGIGDFNGDGTSDILFRDSNSGTAAVWQINNDQVIASVGVGSAPSNWQINGTGDYNGDGKADILWRDNSSGTVAVWELNGGSVIASVGLGAADSSWTIVHHNPIAAMTM